MDADVKTLFREAVLTCLPVFQSLVGRYAVPHLIWRKTPTGQWHGEIERRPDLAQVFIAANAQLSDAGKQFAEAFFLRYPEYGGMVGFRGGFSMNLGHDGSRFVASAIDFLWQRFETFEANQTTIDFLVNEFEAFVDTPTVRLIFRSQLLNFTSRVNSIDLPEGLRIRRMTDTEVSALHGGRMDWLGISPSGHALHEFCIEGETEEPKAFGVSIDAEQPVWNRAKALFDKAILCLRTFKEGRVGYDYVYLYPVTFCPLPLPSFGYGDTYVPFGIYALNAEECEPLAEHAKTVFDVHEPSMEMACSRLADSETRMKPQDQLVDAVIGMEALLLAGLNKEDRRGELRFRFSLHYSTLFGTAEERHQAFRVARHLYDLRSTVAHGATLGDGDFPVGDERLKLPDAAKRASETLRHLVRHFLPDVKNAPYKKHEFWERAYFGLAGLE
jgi:hypothetical protein